MLLGIPLATDHMDLAQALGMAARGEVQPNNPLAIVLGPRSASYGVSSKPMVKAIGRQYGDVEARQ